ncbi:MAG TPA: hypothetical protein VH637_23420 [Streptosporangiaceae bacterium]|jgi:hypothetical protein
MLGGATGALFRVLIGVAAIVIGIALGKVIITIIGVVLVAVFGLRAMAARNGPSRRKPW